MSEFDNVLNGAAKKAEQTLPEVKFEDIAELDQGEDPHREDGGKKSYAEVMAEKKAKCYQHRVMMEALADRRNDFIAENKPTEDVSDLLLKVIDAPTKSSAC